MGHGTAVGDPNRPGDAEGGTYTLLIDLHVDGPAAVVFGAAGECELRPGRYAYTGSALGPGGFARIDRHRRVASGDHAVRHWHVDYLLGHPDARLAGDVRSPGVDAECRIALAVADAAGIEPVPGVGASDCDCSSHLAFGPDGGLVEATVRQAHGSIDG